MTHETEIDFYHLNWRKNKVLRGCDIQLTGFEHINPCKKIDKKFTSNHSFNLDS